MNEGTLGNVTVDVCACGGGEGRGGGERRGFKVEGCAVDETQDDFDQAVLEEENARLCVPSPLLIASSSSSSSSYADSCISPGFAYFANICPAVYLT